MVASNSVWGGVVWDSTAEGEYEEAWAKARFLDASHRLFSLTEAVLWEPETGYFLLAEHKDRLGAACTDFGGVLERRHLDDSLQAEVNRLLGTGQRGPFKLRVLVDPQFVLTVEGEPLSALPDVLTMAFAPQPFGPESLVWRRYKTTDRRVYTQNRADADQTLHYNERGELTETTSMNLVLETNGEFLTPPLSSGLLGGTYRASLLAQGRVREALLTAADLETADQIWLVNSVRRWKKARLT